MKEYRENHIWVVEVIFNPSSKGAKWEPTVGVGLTRDDARREMEEWKTEVQGAQFRIRRYDTTSGR